MSTLLLRLMYLNFATKSFENDVKRAIYREIEVFPMQEISAFMICR